MNNKDILSGAPDGATHWDFNEYMRWDSTVYNWEWECYNENTKNWKYTRTAEATIQSLADIKRIEELENALIILLGATSGIYCDGPNLAFAEHDARKVLER